MKTCLFDKRKMPSYVKKMLNETSKTDEKTKKSENEEEDENVDNENVEFNVNASLKARLYQKHPELMINVFKTKEELEKEEKAHNIDNTEVIGGAYYGATNSTLVLS